MYGIGYNERVLELALIIYETMYSKQDDPPQRVFVINVADVSYRNIELQFIYDLYTSYSVQSADPIFVRFWYRTVEQAP